MEKKGYKTGINRCEFLQTGANKKENLDIFDFELNESDMKTISKLDLNLTQFPEWD